MMVSSLDVNDEMPDGNPPPCGAGRRRRDGKQDIVRFGGRLVLVVAVLVLVLVQGASLDRKRVFFGRRTRTSSSFRPSLFVPSSLSLKRTLSLKRPISSSQSLRQECHKTQKERRSLGRSVRPFVLWSSFREDDDDEDDDGDDAPLWESLDAIRASLEASYSSKKVDDGKTTGNAETTTATTSRRSVTSLTARSQVPQSLDAVADEVAMAVGQKKLQDDDDDNNLVVGLIQFYGPPMDIAQPNEYNEELTAGFGTLVARALRRRGLLSSETAKCTLVLQDASSMENIQAVIQQVQETRQAQQQQQQQQRRNKAKKQQQQQQQQRQAEQQKTLSEFENSVLLEDVQPLLEEGEQQRVVEEEIGVGTNQPEESRTENALPTTDLTTTTTNPEVEEIFYDDFADFGSGVSIAEMPTAATTTETTSQTETDTAVDTDDEQEVDQFRQLLLQTNADLAEALPSDDDDDDEEDEDEVEEDDWTTSFRLTSLYQNASALEGGGIDMDSAIQSSVDENVVLSDEEEIIMVMPTMGRRDMVAVRRLLFNILMHAGGRRKVVLFLNCALQPKPREFLMAGAETLYHVIPYKSAPPPNDDATAFKVMLIRRYPQDWQVYLAVGEGGEYRCIATQSYKEGGMDGPSQEWVQQCVYQHLQEMQQPEEEES